MIRVALTRYFLPATSCLRQAVYYSTNTIPIPKGSYFNEQMEYIKSIMQSNIDDWKSFRKTLLSKQGSINETNVDGVMLKVLVNHNKKDLALSYVNFLHTSGDQLNLGIINGVLKLYHGIGREKPLTVEQKQFILDSYKNLYDKYEVLDAVTCNMLLHALCTIGEWKKALKVLDDIFVTGTPTHSAFSTLIATLFNLNKKEEALSMIEKSLKNQRSLHHVAYEAWINYILRKYKTKSTIVKYLEEICIHISRNCLTIPEETAEMLKETYTSLGWHARTTKIKKQNGQCVYCKSSLECLKLTENEFDLLQKNVKDKLIVGSDVLLKSSDEELKGFLDFVEKTAPYDVVLDALNICYAGGKFKIDKMYALTHVLEHFIKQNKKTLLIGRKHMMTWPNMKSIMNKTCHFFTDDASQDDPYFITATILSGPHTDFISKDLLRGHRFNLQDEHLRHIFQRWQWQHQWKSFPNKSGVPYLQAPLSVTPCAQKTNSSWHIPFERKIEDSSSHGLVKDGTPDWGSWLCLQPTRDR